MDFRDILKLALKEYEDEAKRLLEGLTERDRISSHRLCYLAFHPC